MISTNGNLAVVIAHRGASGDAPENTLAALGLAAEHGATCVEIDVSISADQVPFVHHDDTLDRCTNGNGLLSSYPAAELDLLTAGKGMSEYSQEPLPRLAAVIDLLVEKGLGLNLEIKPRAGLEEATTHAICDMINERWPANLPLVFSSFSHESLGYASKLAPGIARGLLLEAVPDNVMELVKEYNCVNVHCDGGKLHHDDARRIKQNGLGLYCYTVNETEQASRLMDIGVDGIFTDFPKRLITHLGI